MPKKNKKNHKVSEAIKEYINRAMDREIETKYYFARDPGGLNITDTIAQSVNYSTVIVPGTANNQRIGDKIRLQRLTMRANFVQVLNGGTNFQDCGIRVLVVRVKVKSTTTPAIPQLSGSPNGVLYDNGTARACISPINPDTKVMYDVLSDTWLKMDVNATTTADRSYVIYEKDINLGGRLLQYENATNIPDKGDIYVYFMTDVPSPNQISINFDSILFYQDA